ncbi:GIY-YIG nuclease family protein [bacterium]|nr:GIY-YIG nuclease family protein [bacterium]MBU1636745.1 GIY-YIG nuclease family protein [bacterium]
MPDKQYYVYILSSKTQRLYIGVTSDLRKRTWEHRERITDGFAEKYNINRLVYYEVTNDVLSAIQREKRLKTWPRKWKIRLIEGHNPEWNDLAEEWFE